jgi:hypothetical protein
MDLIDRTKCRKDLLYAYDDVSMELDVLDSQPSISAIPIPEGATNGDMLTALFGERALITLDTHNYLKDWWNAPYKAESEE